eukprot:TRINITY_DN6849_c0_g1_i1.p1 TRINITY_DN6849_c0_g1~~TRINITY_DN6849_c0_g1_i1.p1  ORF type:complete len:373 (+),score=89.63 TRINITY_DN6849_c0_g1_i1:64-1182(+)
MPGHTEPLYAQAVAALIDYERAGGSCDDDNEGDGASLCSQEVLGAAVRPRARNSQAAPAVEAQHSESLPRTALSSEDEYPCDWLAESGRTVSSRQVLRQCGVIECADRATHKTTRRRSSLTVNIGGPKWAHVPLWLRPAIAALVAASEEGNDVAAVLPEESTALQWSFQCVDAPELSVAEYAGIVCSVFPTIRVWVQALALLDEFCARTHVQINAKTIHRLLVTAVFAAAQAQCELEDGAVDPVLLGIEADDLVDMVQDFCTGLPDDVLMRRADACVAQLFPFCDTPPGPVAAAYFMSASTKQLPWRERVAMWVAALPDRPEPLKRTKKSRGRNGSIKRTASKVMAKLEHTSQSLKKKMFGRGVAGSPLSSH